MERFIHSPEELDGPEEEHFERVSNTNPHHQAAYSILLICVVKFCDVLRPIYNGKCYHYSQYFAPPSSFPHSFYLPGPIYFVDGVFCDCAEYDILGWAVGDQAVREVRVLEVSDGQAGTRTIERR